MKKHSAKDFKKASTKNKKIKPIKAFFGEEIIIPALIGMAGQTLANEFMGPKTSSVIAQDPFKKYDPSMTPEQYISKSTSAPTVTNAALNPVTSPGSKDSGSGTTDTSTVKNVSNDLLSGMDNREDKPVTGAKKGGSIVRGMGSAIRGFKKSRVL